MTTITLTTGTFATLPTAAHTLGLSYWQLYRLVRTGRVPVARLGRLLLVRLEDVWAVTMQNGVGEVTLTEYGHVLLRPKLPTVEGPEEWN